MLEEEKKVSQDVVLFFSYYLIALHFEQETHGNLHLPVISTNN